MTYLVFLYAMLILGMLIGCLPGIIKWFKTAAHVTVQDGQLAVHRPFRKVLPIAPDDKFGLELEIFDDLYLSDATERLYLIFPLLEVEISPIGSGDFHGAYAWFESNGWNLEEAIEKSRPLRLFTRVGVRRVTA